MSSALQFDEEAARRIETTYLTPDVVAQWQAVLRALELRAGERVLDIGSGPGLLAHDMAITVGSLGRVNGMDISESMLAMSRKRCLDPPWADFRAGDAINLPFSDGEFDVAVSTQVYGYVVDVETALKDAYRVLRPGGRLLVVDTDWHSIVWHSTSPARMNRILDAWNEHLVDPYLPRTLHPRLKRAGFHIDRHQVIPLLNTEFNPNTYSYGLMALVAKFVVGRRGVTEGEAAAWLEDFQTLGESGAYFFSLNRYLFLAVKPSALRASHDQG
jgi:arsenite methyltransferase